MREGFFHNPLYWLSCFGAGTWLKLRFRLRWEGSEHIPLEGGAILASNHCSYLDPPVLTACSPKREVHFMARDTLFSNPIARWYFPRVGVIPLDRTRGDLAALRKAIAYLREGQVIGLFPEGTRSPDGRLRNAKGGIGFLIAKGNVPVVPIYISGTFEAFPKGSKGFHRSHIAARIGRPITPEELRAAMSGKGDYQAVGDLVMSRIRELAELSNAGTV
ncbi:MAG: 1-acyl-sn-glycerol-3-phosphate acyltransferase [Verrucomicrobiota bacterium]|jgi:1-acyl-sn-glycerol-3-phosphate acyltransferase|nr:1-acyl-sn-glycerol-3-phosphate acyltransferase [Verrucomicrobiota bacterium]